MNNELTLVCLLWPGDINDTVNITTDIEHNAYDLKEALFRGPYSSRLIFTNILKLKMWKCSIRVDDECQTTLNTIRFDGSDSRLQRLHPALRLANYFTEEPLLKDCIHIIFEIPKLDTPPSSLAIPNPITNDLLRERRKFNSKISRKSLLSQAVPPEFAEMQENSQQAIIWSRPHTNDKTIPVTLYHAVFRQFMDDCKTYQPCAEDNALAFELSVRMSGFFEDDEARAEELRDIFQQHGIFLFESAVDSDFEFLAHGDIRVDTHRIVILALRNEIGGGSAEPYAQAILSYMHSTWPATERLLMFNFPCLILNLFGPHISFSGAVWSVRPHFQVLSSVLPLFMHHTDKDMRATVARHIGAFKKAIHSLTECYMATLACVLPNFVLAPCFPDPHEYYSLIEPQGVAVHFEYIYQLHKDKLLFMAKTDDHGCGDKMICVKFVRQYSRDTHEKCASMGIAPRLRGFENIGGGWMMVVMDVLDEEYVRIHDLEPNILISKGVSDGLREKLAELHKANLVHGDMRDVNILVRGNGEDGFMLIDFDWAGVVGEVRYPMNVFKGRGLWRPDGAVDGELINPAHDIAMLDHLFSARSTQDLLVTPCPTISAHTS